MAISRNRNTVFQVVWQVQQGAEATVTARPSRKPQVSGPAPPRPPPESLADANSFSRTSPGAAGAFNESVTVQFVWQLQIGCVAFCYETSQT